MLPRFITTMIVIGFESLDEFTWLAQVWSCEKSKVDYASTATVFKLYLGLALVQLREHGKLNDCKMA